MLHKSNICLLSCVLTDVDTTLLTLAFHTQPFKLNIYTQPFKFNIYLYQIKIYDSTIDLYEYIFLTLYNYDLNTCLSKQNPMHFFSSLSQNLT